MNQHAKVKIAILRSLKRMPKTYTMRDEALRAEVCLDVQPRPRCWNWKTLLRTWNNLPALSAPAMN